MPGWVNSAKARLACNHQLGFPSYLLLCPDNNCSQTTEDERCELHCRAILTHQRHVGTQALLWYLGSVCPYRRIAIRIRHQITHNKPTCMMEVTPEVLEDFERWFGFIWPTKVIINTKKSDSVIIYLFIVSNVF